jgi:hypothetical protein
MALLLKHQTAEQFVTRLRAAYRDASRERLVQIARFIIGRLQAGDITDAQCRAAFGLNTTQWNAIKTKMQNLITSANAVESAVGE